MTGWVMKEHGVPDSRITKDEFGAREVIPFHYGGVTE